MTDRVRRYKENLRLIKVNFTTNIPKRVDFASQRNPASAQ